MRRGSSQEGQTEEGLAHFIEHAVFKGTEKYPAPQIIAEASDCLGGSVDAFTGKECACFYGKVLKECLPGLTDLLCDLVSAPIFAPDEMERERHVILEEISQSQDHPEDFASELFYQNFWAGSPLAHPILGRPDQVRSYTPENIRDFFIKTYTPKNLLVTAAGDIDSIGLTALVETRLKNSLGNSFKERAPMAKPNRCRPFVKNVRRENLNQASLVIGFPAPWHRHADRIASALLCYILGGGMSSRLFLELREKRAICYQVGSFTTHYTDSGALQIYASCASSKARELVQRTIAECRLLAAEGPSAEELDRAKLQLRTSLVFSQENSSSRMFSLAHQAMCMDSILDIDQQLAEIDNTDIGQVFRVAREILVPGQAGVSALGVKKNGEIRAIDLS